MAIIETDPGREQTVLTTAKIAIRSLSPNFDWEDEQKRAAFQSCVTEEVKLPLNVEDDTFAGIMGVVEERRLAGLSIDYSAPYWAPDTRYERLHVLNFASEYLDKLPSSYPLPMTVLPPEKDVQSFIDRVMASNRPLTAPQQLEIALDETGNNIVGAANVKVVAARHMARGYERRAYPNIAAGPREIAEWNKHVAQFEVYGKSKDMDGPGDGYYFDTQFWTALVLKSLGGTRSEIHQQISKHGPQAMRFVRTYIARRPTQTPHEEASVLGREIGLAVAEAVGVNHRPIFKAA